MMQYIGSMLRGSALKGPAPGEPANIATFSGHFRTTLDKLGKYFSVCPKKMIWSQLKPEKHEKRGPKSKTSIWRSQIAPRRHRLPPFPTSQISIGFWKVIFAPKRGSGGGSELSVGAQTLRTCATHQLSRFWKFERKIFTLTGEILIFRFSL